MAKRRDLVETMRIEYIRGQIRGIRQDAWDNEAAHRLQDRLLFEVLEAIAKGAPDAKVLAKEVHLMLTLQSVVTKTYTALGDDLGREHTCRKGFVP